MRECIKRNKLLLLLTIIFSIISSAAMVGLSLLIQTTIDYVTIGNMDGFKRILIYSVGYGILIGLLYFIYDILSKMFIRNLLKMLRNKYSSVYLEETIRILIQKIQLIIFQY